MQEGASQGMFRGRTSALLSHSPFQQIDICLIPIMAVLYLLSHIDRTNIGNAKIEGMDKDLRLTGNQYNIATTIFFGTSLHAASRHRV